MDDSGLDPEELEAIRSAMQSASSGRSHGPLPEGVEPLSLTGRERAAAAARKVALAIGARWARELTRRLRPVLGSAMSIEVGSADLVDGAALRDQLSSRWCQAVEPVGRRGRALVSVGGAIVVDLCARLLGSSGADDDLVEPSRTALRLFAPIGDVVVSALEAAWHLEQSCPLRAPADRSEAERSVLDSDCLVALRLEVSGESAGHALLLTEPETLLPPPASPPAVAASPADIEEALGAVPVEVRVCLGTARLRSSELARLGVGRVLALGSFLDDPLGIECGGVVKAMGRPLVHRGVLSVRVCPEGVNGGEE